MSLSELKRIASEIESALSDGAPRKANNNNNGSTKTISLPQRTKISALIDQYISDGGIVF
jgi:hypothetical protein